jgi:hypothetical protein
MEADVGLAYAKAEMKVADELYLALALLHREQPQVDAFTVKEVVARAAQEGFEARPASLRAHAHGHAAANLPPGKNMRYRLLFKQEDGRVRLLRSSDYVHPDRHQKFYPELLEIPERYHPLVGWARKYSESPADSGAPGRGWLAGLHQMRGLGRDVWLGVNPDEYVRSLREGWE